MGVTLPTSAGAQTVLGSTSSQAQLLSYSESTSFSVGSGTVIAAAVPSGGSYPTVSHALTVSNTGIVTNAVGITFILGLPTDEGTIANSGSLTNIINFGISPNTSTSSNIGNFTNAGYVTNNVTAETWGFLVGRASFSNTGTIAGEDTIVSTGQSSNEGTILADTNGLIVSAGLFSNSGTILGATDAGVILSGGSLGNTGRIEGGRYGIVLANATVSNAGTILDDGVAGASLGNGAVLTNAATGLVKGVTGIVFTGTGASVVNSGTIVGTGGVAVQFDAGVNSLTLDTGSVLTGSIDGGGGAGLVKLAGTGTFTNMIAHFEDGSSLTVGSGADWTASGNWAIAGVTNTGTLQPGTSGSPLKLSGNFTQTASGTLRVTLDAGGAGSLLQVTGSAKLAGTVLAASTGTFAKANTTYTILTASGGVTGAFAGISVTPDYSALLAPSLSYDADDAFVTLIQRKVSVVGGTRNELATADGFDRAQGVASETFSASLTALDQLSAAGVHRALDHLSGETYTGLATTALQSGGLFTEGLLHQGYLARLGQAASPEAVAAAGGGNRLQLATLADGGIDDPVANIDRPWGVWASGYGQTAQQAGDGNAHRLTDTASGGSAGVDYRLTRDIRIGAALGAGTTNFGLDDDNGRAQVDHTLFALTAAWSGGPAYLDGTIAVGYGDGTLRRSIGLPGLAAQASSHVTDDQVVGGIEAGYAAPIADGAAVTPFARLTIDHVDQNGSRESGAGALDLDFRSRSTDSVRSVFGGRLNAALPLGAVALATDLSVGWAHEFASTDRTATVAFAGSPGDTFQVTGAQAASDTAQIGVGLATAVFAGTSVFVHYDGDLGGPTTSHAFTAGLRISW